MRKNFFDEDYFEDVNSEEKAYWLGFIAADGYISYTPKNKCLQIALAEKDRGHLLKFKNSVNFTGEIRHKKPVACVLNMYSKKMASDLMSLGIVPSKSLVLKPWQGKKKLLQHYWRGYFDGDGCFTYCLKKRKSTKDYIAWNCNMLGTEEMVTEFGKFVEYRNKKYDYNMGTVGLHGKGSKIWKISYGGIRPSQSVARALYQNANIYLDRKYLLSKRILETTLAEKVIKDNFSDTKFLINLYDELKSWNKVADKIGVSRNGLYKHIRKFNLPRRKWGRYRPFDVNKVAK